MEGEGEGCGHPPSLPAHPCPCQLQQVNTCQSPVPLSDGLEAWASHLEGSGDPSTQPVSQLGDTGGQTLERVSAPLSPAKEACFCTLAASAPLLCVLTSPCVPVSS